MTNEQKCIVLAKAQWPPKEIAKEVGLAVTTVYHYLGLARRMGEAIPKFKRGAHSTTLYVPVPRRLADSLQPIAQKRELTVQELTVCLLDLIVSDDLVNAVLDAGGDDA